MVSNTISWDIYSNFSSSIFKISSMQKLLNYINKDNYILDTITKQLTLERTQFYLTIYSPYCIVSENRFLTTGFKKMPLLISTTKRTVGQKIKFPPTIKVIFQLPYKIFLLIYFHDKMGVLQKKS